MPRKNPPAYNTPPPEPPRKSRRKPGVRQIGWEISDATYQRLKDIETHEEFTTLRQALEFCVRVVHQNLFPSSEGPP